MFKKIICMESGLNNTPRTEKATHLETILLEAPSRNATNPIAQRAAYNGECLWVRW